MKVLLLLMWVNEDSGAAFEDHFWWLASQNVPAFGVDVWMVSYW